MLQKIVSGGQTGVDRAALDVAIELGIEHGGWCPKGRWAEDAPINEKYQLTETDSPEPSVRTKLNVRDSDGTLIFIKGQSVGEGTQLTIDEARRLKKPLLIFNVSEQQDPAIIEEWVSQNNIRILNIAGPRASQSVDIYHDVCFLLRNVLRTLKQSFLQQSPN